MPIGWTRRSGSSGCTSCPTRTIAIRCFRDMRAPFCWNEGCLAMKSSSARCLGGFRRACRRTLGPGGLSAREKRQIAENLGEHWGVSGDVASDAIEKELTDTEEQTLKGLNDFNF